MIRTDEYSSLLSKFKNRIKLILIEKSISQWLFYTGIFSCSILIVDLLTEHFISLLMLAGIVFFSILMGVTIIIAKKISEVEIAKAIEKYSESDNSISTAAVFKDENNEFYALIHEKAIINLKQMNPDELFKISWRRNHIFIAIIWTTVFLLYFLPEIPWFLTPEQRSERELIHITGINLQKQAKELEKIPEAEKYPELKKISKNMSNLGKKMERRRISKKEAMKQLNKIENRLNEIGQKITADEFKKDSEAMKNAGKVLKELLEKKMTKLREHAGKVNEEIKKGANLDKLPPEDKLAKEIEERMNKISDMLQNADVDGLTEQLQQVGDEMQQGEMSDAEKKEMADSLKQLENEFKNMSSDELSKALKEAAKQLENDKKNGTKNAGKSLKNAAGKIKWRISAGNKGSNGVKQLIQGNGKVGGKQPENSNNSNNKNSGNQQNGTPGSNNGNPGKNNGKHNTLTGKNNGSQPGNTEGNSELKIDYSNASMSVTIPSKIKGKPGKSTTSKVPYYEYFAKYKQRADSAVESEDIPIADKEMVKTYFETLNPATVNSK